VRSPQSMMSGRTSFRALAQRWIAIRPVWLVWQSVSAPARAASQPSVDRANPRRPKCLSGTLRAQSQKLSSWDASGAPPDGPAARPVPTGSHSEPAKSAALRASHLTVLVTRLHFSDQSRNIRAFGASLRCFGVAAAKARGTGEVSVEFTVTTVAPLGDSPWYDACSSSPQPARPADEGSL